MREHLTGCLALGLSREGRHAEAVAVTGRMRSASWQLPWGKQGSDCVGCSDHGSCGGSGQKDVNRGVHATTLSAEISAARLRVVAEVALATGDLDSCEAHIAAARQLPAKPGGVGNWTECWAGWVAYRRTIEHADVSVDGTHHVDGGAPEGCAVVGTRPAGEEQAQALGQAAERIQRGLDTLLKGSAERALAAYWLARLHWDHQGGAGSLTACVEWAAEAVERAPRWGRAHELFGVARLRLLGPRQAPRQGVDHSARGGAAPMVIDATMRALRLAVALQPSCAAAGLALSAIVAADPPHGPVLPSRRREDAVDEPVDETVDEAVDEPVDEAVDEAAAEMAVEATCLEALGWRPASSSCDGAAGAAEGAPRLAEASRVDAALRVAQDGATWAVALLGAIELAREQRGRHKTKGLSASIRLLQVAARFAVAEQPASANRDCFVISLMAREALVLAYERHGRKIAAASCMRELLVLSGLYGRAANTHVSTHSTQAADLLVPPLGLPFHAVEDLSLVGSSRVLRPAALRCMRGLHTLGDARSSP